MWTSYSVSGWGLVNLTFVSYFFSRYYDIGVPCKLLPPYQGDRAVFLHALSIYRLVMDGKRFRQNLWNFYEKKMRSDGSFLCQINI